MTEREERQAERGGAPEATPGASEFMAEGRRRVEEFAKAQNRFWDQVQSSNRKWLGRVQDEVTMTADFASKLTAAKSFTETASLVQNWTVKHMEMATQDARQAMSDTQDILAAGARFWSNIADGAGRHGS